MGQNNEPEFKTIELSKLESKKISQILIREVVKKFISIYMEHVKANSKFFE